MLLNNLQKEQYHQQGYLVLENFISQAQCTLLMQQATHLIKQFDAEKHHTIFSPEKKTHIKDQYFLDSGDKIHFFFEDHVFDSNGKLTKDKHLAINKIGHGLHDCDPVFDSFSRQHKLAKLAECLDIEDPLLLQSMYICKQPFIGGEVTAHQDNTFLYTEPNPVTGFWIALEDATLDNGCLWALPGGHQHGLKSQMKIQANGFHLEIYDDTPFEVDKMIPLPVKAGTLIVLHGLLPHMSKENTSAASRHAYTLHVISSQDRYAASNWLQRKQPLRGFY
jgi:phytanoyl-CoA hydroxylase